MSCAPDDLDDFVTESIVPEFGDELEIETGLGIDVFVHYSPDPYQPIQPGDKIRIRIKKVVEQPAEKDASAGFGLEE